MRHRLPTKTPAGLQFARSAPSCDGMNVMLLRLSLLATVALAMPLAAQDTDESALEALDKQPAPAFKPPEAPGSAELRDAVRRMALGPRILRAETAAIAAISLWMGRHGDWADPA